MEGPAELGDGKKERAHSVESHELYWVKVLCDLPVTPG